MGWHCLSPRIRLRKLTRPAQFDDVLSRGCAYGGVHYVVKVHHGGSPLARLGIIAARRAIPRAVDRNASKRLAREAFRQHEKTLAGLDVVVICRAPILAAARAKARLELNRLFTKAAAGRIAPG